MSNNLILQNWHDANLPDIARESVANIAAYSARIGADHRLVTGVKFHPALSTMCQQVLLLNPEFDEWENVARIDCDMFTRPGLTDDLFSLRGYGFHQKEAHIRVCRALPKLTSSTTGFYGGCLYKFNRDERRLLRSVANIDELKQFDVKQRGHDEGILHRLCLLAKLPVSYFPDTWCHGSYWPHPETAKIIHVRWHGGKDKMEHLRALRTKGIL